MKPRTPHRNPAQKKRAPEQLRQNKPTQAKPVSHREPADLPVRLVQIEKPIYGGAFLARDEGKAVFVPLALAGEQARVRIVEGKRGYATAEVEEIIQPAPQRVTPGCRHFGVCGGCQYQHADYATQVAIKKTVLRETLQRGGVEAPGEIAVIADQPWGYRNRIRLAFDAQGDPGYRGRRSHAVVPIAECPIAAPLLVRAALAAAEVMRQVAPLLRPTEIALFCNQDETALLITFFIASPAKAGLDVLASSLGERIPELMGAELVVGGRPDQPQPEVAELPRVAQWGETSLVYRAAGVDYRVDHGAFFQVNRWLVDALVEQVTAGLGGDTAWDLFAGVGLFARKLTDAFAKVIAIESAPAAAKALAANLHGTSGTALKASTLEFLKRKRVGGRPDLIVVDPPRTGLGAEITAVLLEIAPPALVYVSCDPATLARDLRMLVEGGYAIESITLADLFPQTFHLETVVRLLHP
jgi:23S rRNA (uracil1939-C5)-methyltransferase